MKIYRIAQNSIRYELIQFSSKGDNFQKPNVERELWRVTAFDGDAIIGRLSFTRYYSNKYYNGKELYECPYISVDHQYVDKQYQGKGIMTEMYRKVKERFPNDKFEFYGLTSGGYKLKESLLRQNIVQEVQRLALNRMAQTSSIMYKGLPSPNIIVPSNVILTPSPDLAKMEGEHVAAFALKGGDFFAPHMMDKNLCKALKSMLGKGIDCYRALMDLINNPTKQWNDLLSGMGYSGFIADDYLYLFDNKLLRFLGFYDFERRTLKR